MFTRNDLIDLMMRELALPQEKKGPAESSPDKKRLAAACLLPKGRLFLSEHEIKKRLTPQAQQLTIPKEAILSPLAVDWLILRAIKVMRQ